MPEKVEQASQITQITPITPENCEVENCNRKGHAFGRAFTWICKSTIDIGKGVYGGGVKVARSLAKLADEPCEFARIFRLFINIVLLGSYATGKENMLTNFQAKAGDAAMMADTYLLLGDIGYWGQAAVKGSKIEKDKEDKASQFAKDLRDKKYAMIGAKAAFVPTNISGTMLTLGGFGILKLDSIAEKIGKIPVLGLVTKIPLLTFCRVAVTTAYAFLGANAVQNLRDAWGNNQQKVTHSIMKLAHCVSEIALKVICLAGVVTLGVIAPLGILAATLGISSFLYKVNNEEAIDRKPVAQGA